MAGTEAEPDVRILELLDLPAELRTPEEEDAVRAHLDLHPELAEAVAALDVGLAAFAADFALEPPAAAMDRLAARVAADRPAPAPSFVASLLAWFEGLRLPMLAPALAVAAVAALVLTRPPADVRPQTTEKGATRARFAPGVDLQMSVERGAASVVPAADRMVIGADDGLIVRCQVSGSGTLSLVERDPEHHLRVVYQWTLDRKNPAEAAWVGIQDESGNPLRYTPDGPPGEYTFLAVLTERPLAADAQLLDAVWQGWVERLMDDATVDGLVLDGMRIRYLPAGTPAPGNPVEAAP